MHRGPAPVHFAFYGVSHFSRSQPALDGRQDHPVTRRAAHQNPGHNTGKRVLWPRTWRAETSLTVWPGERGSMRTAGPSWMRCSWDRPSSDRRRRVSADVDSRRRRGPGARRRRARRQAASARTAAEPEDHPARRDRRRCGAPRRRGRRYGQCRRCTRTSSAAARNVDELAECHPQSHADRQHPSGPRTVESYSELTTGPSAAGRPRPRCRRRTRSGPS